MDTVSMILSLFSTRTTKCMMSTVRVSSACYTFTLMFASACSGFDLTDFLVICLLQIPRQVIQILCCTPAVLTALL